MITKKELEKIMKILAKRVDRIMINDLKECFSHGSSATLDICISVVQDFVGKLNRMKNDGELSKDLYTYYYENFLFPEIKD